MVIVGEQVSVAPNDKEELVPTVAAISPVVAEEVQAVLVDSGFYSEAAVRALWIALFELFDHTRGISL